MVKQRLLTVPAVLCLLLSGCGVLQGTPVKDSDSVSGRLTMTGSTAMALVCQSLGEVFAEHYPGVTVEKGGSGSGEAVEAVRSGMAMLGDLSRPLQAEEHPEDFVITPIAADVIVFVVSVKNPVTAVTKEQLQKIFSGQITNWSALGGEDRPITCIGREAASGTRSTVEALLHCDQPAYRCVFSSTGEIVTRVSGDPDAIGYCSLASLHSGVRALKVDGVSPSLQTAKTQRYPYRMELFQIYKKGRRSPLLNAWFGFVRSEEGQALIEACGLLALA